MRTIAFLVLLVATPALSEIRSDQPLTPPAFGPAPAIQESARVASDGTNFFAVWRTRTASDGTVIACGRVAPTGELLDRPSILIASIPGLTLGQPDVVFVGGNFLVVYPSGISTLLARRFSPDGRPVDSKPVLISNNNRMFGWLATNGKTVLLLVEYHYFYLLAADGTPIVYRDLGYGAPDSASVASNGDRYLIAFKRGQFGSTAGLLVLLKGTGELLASRTFGFPDPLSPGDVALASNGSSFLLTVSLLRRVSNGGDDAGPVGCMVVDADANPGALRILDDQLTDAPLAIWSGSEYLLAWTRYVSASSRIFGARVDDAGVPLDVTPIPISSQNTTVYDGGTFVSAASNGRDTIVITGRDDYASGWVTSAAIFKSLPQRDAEPASRRRIAIGSSVPEQANGSIASNGTLSLVAWRERSGFETHVRAALIAADGEVGAPMDVGESHSLTTTATASNGRDFLVAYFDPDYRLVARRVTIEGVLDSNPILLGSFGSRQEEDALTAGWSSQAYLVLTAGRIHGVTISATTPNGAVTAPQLVLAPNSEHRVDTPAVQCGTAGCIATWHSLRYFFDCCSDAPEYENNRMAFTDLSGKVLSQVPLTDAVGAGPALSIVGSEGRSVFVYGSRRGMFAGRMTAAGVVLDTPAVNGGVRVMNSATTFALQPVTVAYGGLYFVEPDSATNGRLYWTRIEPEPAPHVTTIVDLHQSVPMPPGWDQSMIRFVPLAASARNTYLVYSRGDDDATLMAPRLFLRTLASPDPQTSTPRKRAAR